MTGCTKLFTHKGYDIWMSEEGLYGICKRGAPAPWCGRRYLHTLLADKGI